MSPSGVGPDRARAAHLRTEPGQHERGAARRAGGGHADLLDELRRPGPRGSASTGPHEHVEHVHPHRDRASSRSSLACRTRLAVAARERGGDDRFALLAVEHPRLAHRRRAPVDACAPTRAAGRAPARPRGRRPARSCRGWPSAPPCGPRARRAPRPPARASRTSHSARPARAAERQHLVVDARQLVEHARQRGRDRRVRVHDCADLVARGRRRGAGRPRRSARAPPPPRAVEIDDRHLLGLELREHGARRRDRDELLGSHARRSRRCAALAPPARAPGRHARPCAVLARALVSPPAARRREQ